MKRAADAALHAAPDEAHRLPAPNRAPDLVGNEDPETGSFSAEEKVELARRIESAAREHDPRVRRTRESTYQDVIARALLGLGRARISCRSV